MSAVQTIITKYGDPDPVYQEKYCSIWKVKDDFPWFPANEIFINNDFKAKLNVIFMRLQTAGVHTEIKTFDGCYNERSVRGMQSESLHAWALAIDLNAATEKLAQENTNWSAQFIAIFKAAGIFWGGDWNRRKDSMHFALFNG